MKKVLILLLINIVLLSIVSCSPEEDNSLPNNDIQKEEPADQNKDSETEEDIEEDVTIPNNDIVEKDIKTESGRYIGQADSNFIEIKISGVPDNIDPVVFMLSEEVKVSFDTLRLETEDNVKIEYYINENDQKVIMKIEKI